MDVLNYKGFEITLDTSTGKFTADGATRRNKSEFEGTTLNGVKKKINDFIKENAAFGAFHVRPKYEKGGWDLDKLKKIVTIKGITSNKRLTIQDYDGKTGTIGSYDINRYVIYNEKDNEVIDNCLNIKKEKRDFDKICDDKIDKLMSTVTEIKLSDFIKEAGIEVDMNERGY